MSEKIYALISMHLYISIASSISFDVPNTKTKKSISTVGKKAYKQTHTQMKWSINHSEVELMIRKRLY